MKLGSATKEEAAREAAALYAKVLSDGWPTLAAVDETVSEELSGAVADGPTEIVTIGDWIEFASGKANVQPRSVGVYCDSLRTVVSEILGLADTPKLKRKAIVLATDVEILTKANIQKWVDARVAKSKILDPVQARRAKNTIRTLVGNAKGLFSCHLLELEDAPRLLVSPVPFHDVKLPPKQVARYSSRFDVARLLEKAREELSEPPALGSEEGGLRFEQWKILYLALVAGLRYSEIDRLRTQDISTRTGKICVRLHQDFRPKTLSSEGDVQVSDDAMAEIGKMLEHSEEGWFLKANCSRRFKNYRAGMSHDGLVRWLRAYAENTFQPFADVPKPIHELRKEAGTLVNSKHGLAEAKNFLRHGSIATTATYYVGSKGGITTGLD